MEASSRNHSDQAGETSSAKKEGHARSSKKRSATHSVKSRARVSRPGVVGFIRELPKTLGVQLRAHPPQTVVAIGAVSFALGAVLGSRLGRLMLAVAVPLALKSAFEGGAARELGKYARGLILGAQSPRHTDA
jgi:hypothetical protein